MRNVPVLRRVFEPGEIRYVYMRDFVDGSALSIGFMYDNAEKMFEYTVGFCSPRDRFSKKKAHKIIEGRLGAKCSIRFHNDTDLKYGEAIREIMKTYDAETWREIFHMPSWAADNIENMIEADSLIGRISR